MPSNRTLAVAGAVLLVAGWLFYSHYSIGALREREHGLRFQIADLRVRVQEKIETIKDIRALEQKASNSRAELDRLESGFPTASPLVWIPARMEEHFRRFGFREPIVRLNSTRDEPELPGYQRIFWTVGLPLQEGSDYFPIVLRAVAKLEQAEPVVRVIDLAIQTDPLNSPARAAAVTVVTLVRN